LIEELFMNLIETNETFRGRYKLIKSQKEKINYLRSMAINRLVKDTAALFIDHEEEFVNGKKDVPLMDILPAGKKQVLDTIIKYSLRDIYQSEPVLKIEIAGKKVLPDLLEKFTAAVLEPEKNKQLYKLIPASYKGGENNYEKLLNIAMFISDMTDRKAVEYYKNLNGISLAGY